MNFATDVAHAARSLRRDPWHSVPVVLILALGIAATVAVYSVVQGVLLRPLPYAAPSELVVIHQEDPEAGYEYMGASGPSFRDWQQAETLEALAATSGAGRAILGGDPDPLRVARASVTGEFFQVLGVRPAVGRFLTTEDAATGARVAVLSDGLWRRRFGGSPDVVGEAVVLDGASYEVVGVARPDLDLPGGTEVWTILPRDAEFFEVRFAHILGVYGRLRGDATPAAAEAELNAILAEVPGYEIEARVTPLRARLVGEYRTPLLILLGAVALVLLVASANAGTLLLARLARRRRELAVRQALGAWAGRLTRQILAESGILALIAGALGLLLAAWLLDGLVALAPRELPRVTEVGIDPAVLGFAVVVSLATGLLTGLVPALRSRRVAPVADLREGRGGARTGRVRRAFVVTEVALSVVLLFAAGLLVKSFLGIVTTDPGFRTAGVTTFEVALPDYRYGGDWQVLRYQDQLLEAVRSIPGVQSAAVARNLPVTGGDMISPALVEGVTLEDPPQVQIAAVSDAYLETMGMRVVEGRGFRASDTGDAPPVALVNEAFVRDYLDGDGAVGRQARTYFGEPVMREIVGVVATAAHATLTEDPPPKFYYPAAQFPAAGFHLVVRSEARTEALVPAVRAAVLRVDPSVPLGEIATLDQLLARTTAQPRFYAITLGVFAGLGLLLALAGFFAVLSQTVTARNHELGVRLAIGARPGELLRAVLRDGLTLTGLGLAIGLLGALAAARLLRNLLHEVGPADPLVLAGVIALLAAVSVLASWLPARRAARTDPMATLRVE